MTVIERDAVLKKKLSDGTTIIIKPYTDIDSVEGGLNQTEIEELINNAGFLDETAVNAILASYYTKNDADRLFVSNEDLKTITDDISNMQEEISVLQENVLVVNSDGLLCIRYVEEA